MCYLIYCSQSAVEQRPFQLRAPYLVTHYRHFLHGDSAAVRHPSKKKHFSIEDGLGNGTAFPREWPHVTVIFKIDKNQILPILNNSLITEITVTKASLLNTIGLVFHIKIITFTLKFLLNGDGNLV